MPSCTPFASLLEQSAVPPGPDGGTRIVLASLDDLGRQGLAGRRVLLVTSQGFIDRGLVGRVQESLPGSDVRVHAAQPNPDIRALSAALAALRVYRPELVVGIGGGSALDSAKVLALLLAAGCGLEVVDVIDRDLSSSGLTRLPLVLVPTTSGTGSEVTPFATVWDFERARKHSVGADQLKPDLALLDASLTHSVPLDTLKWSGLDAISHALESLWNRAATAQSRRHSFAALTLALPSLRRLLQQPDAQASYQLQCASTLAGLAIAHTRTALAHSISYPLTARFQVPHGLACSFTLAAILHRNLDHLPTSAQERDVLLTAHAFLSGLRLGHEVQRYAGPKEIVALSGEMITPQRAGNYGGAPLPDVAALVAQALDDI